MNEYEGLNLPQLLDLLNDPVVPAPVPWLPQTPGWWIVFAWLAGVVLILALAGYRRRQRNRYRREALAALRALAGTPDAATAGRIATVLKRAALAAYPRKRVAQLSGEAWAAFLKETSRNDQIVAHAAADLATAAYRRDPDAAGLIEPAARWIRVHRA